MRDRVRLHRPKPGRAEQPEVAGREPHQLHDLQRRVGNAAVVQMVGAQAKLKVGAANDPAEREADLVAAQVMQQLDGGAQAPAPADAGPARKVRRKAAPGPVGPEGGDVTDEVAASIDGKRGGGGAALPDGVRGSMEGAFGADLGDVRVHTGGEADTLSQALGARAFTTGNDIFFANGEYDPSSRAGQETLAHELTHTVQQTGGAARQVRRLTLANTNWEAADNGFVTEGGGTGGVAIIRDGQNPPVVVKAGEHLPAEILIAANLANDGLTGEEEGGWSLSTPEARVADPEESKRIAANIPRAMGDKVTEPHAQKFLNKLGEPYTVVFDHAAGTDFSKILEKQKGSKKKKIGKGEELDKKSTVGQFFTNPGQMIGLGKSAALDVYLGNGDRLVGMFGPQNWMVDEKNKTIQLIDNAMNTDENFFTANEEFDITAEGAFDAWMKKAWVTEFAAGNDGALAKRVIDKFGDAIDLKYFANGTDPKVLKSTFTKQRAKMEQWFAGGVATGRRKLLASLGDPMKAIAGVPVELQEEALTSVLARKYVLEGNGQNAWQRAQAEAQRLLAPKQQNAPVDEEEEQPKGGGGGKWVRGERPTSWTSATPSRV
ncbi:MAG: hypothetical protein JWN67_4399 [Actinomycetia bacterium]|nr:hypothetical protein [Actinomycetes bacterium]